MIVTTPPSLTSTGATQTVRSLLHISNSPWNIQILPTSLVKGNGGANEKESAFMRSFFSPIGLFEDCVYFSQRKHFSRDTSVDPLKLN